MRNICLLLLILFLTVGEIYAYAIKVYDEYGNRLGTYRKVGDSYEFYDFYDHKVDKAEDLIKNAPTQQTLSEVSQRIYDENMMPIGTFTSGLYATGWRNYPRRYVRPNFINNPRPPYMVCPRANGNHLYRDNGYYHRYGFKKTIPIRN